MLKRIKNIWQMSKYLEVTHDQAGSPVLHVYKDPPPELGDGQAEFLGAEMTEQEMIDFQHEEVNGWSKLKRALGLV